MSNCKYSGGPLFGPLSVKSLLASFAFFWFAWAKYGFWWGVWYFIAWPWYLGYKLAQWAI